jgi:hypothetical protein
MRWMRGGVGGISPLSRASPHELAQFRVFDRHLAAKVASERLADMERWVSAAARHAGGSSRRAP